MVVTPHQTSPQQRRLKIPRQTPQERGYLLYFFAQGGYMLLQAGNKLVTLLQLALCLVEQAF